MPQDPSPPRVAVIGGGPAGLMAAEVLAEGGAAVTVYERMPSLGRKFLLAGRGGLNLTHSEPLDAFLARYGAAEPHLCAADRGVPAGSRARLVRGARPEDLRRQRAGACFRKAMKASPLLRAWLAPPRRGGRRVSVAPSLAWVRRWRQPAFHDTEPARSTVATDATVLALGGASWPRLGSDGGWVGVLERTGVESRRSRRPTAASSSIGRRCSQAVSRASR